MIGWMTIFFVVLAVIILYFIVRMRTMLKGTPGANSEMNTKELIKNWQDQKAKEDQYKNELRARAIAEAKPEIEAALVQQYKQEAIKQATTPKTDQLKEKLGNTMGVDINRATSSENVDRMIGKRQDVNGQVGSANIFSQDRIDRMAGKGINEDKLSRAASSEINWDKGVNKSLKSEHKMSGLDRALYRK